MFLFSGYGGRGRKGSVALPDPNPNPRTEACREGVGYVGGFLLLSWCGVSMRRRRIWGWWWIDG